MRKRTKDLLYPILTVVAFVVAIIIFMQLPNVFPSEDWTTMRNNFITIMPWLLLFGIGIVSLGYIMTLGEEYWTFPLLTCFVISIGMSMLLRTLYDQGIVIDEMVTGTITITDLQFIIILAWTVLGILLGVTKRR